MSQSQPRLKTSAMIASIADEGQATVPAPFGVALSKLAAQRPDIVGMTADLSKYTDLHIFAQAFPDRFFQMGMAEQLLMAAAGGMAKEGFIPFATTYAAFATRRAYDFIHQVIAEDLRGAAGPDDRLWPQPSGHRRSGDHARYPRDGYRRSLRCAGDRAGGTGHCRSPGAGVYASAAR